jgi:hypothetical protein
VPKVEMSLGIAFKGPDGIVLAADSRVSLMAKPAGQELLLHAVYDNATKLLRVNGQDFVGAITFGAGAIGQTEPRTANSFLPEFEQELGKVGGGRLSVKDFSDRLSGFFLDRWKAAMPSPFEGQDMVFLVGGFDQGDAYGRVFQFSIPKDPTPVEQLAGQFGLSWGGQREIADRLLQGFDPRMISFIAERLKLTAAEAQELNDGARAALSLPIPYQFLPLQDCVDLSIFLVRATIVLQSWVVGIRGVGGAIDVATITRVGGFNAVQSKSIRGEREAGRA